jgi:hypothetical protein
MSLVLIQQKQAGEEGEEEKGEEKVKEEQKKEEQDEVGEMRGEIT